MRAFVRWKDALHKPERGDRLHLREALQRRTSWRTLRTLIARTRNVSVGESCVTVRRSDESVEVCFEPDVGDSLTRHHQRSEGFCGASGHGCV